MADEVVPVAVGAEGSPAPQENAGKPDVPVTAGAAAGDPPVATEDGGQKPESKDGTADADKPTGAPETYEAFKLPEGMEIDGEAVTEAQGVFKELNLTQEQAQKLVDIQAKQVQKMAESNQKAFSDLVSGWLEDARNDPEIGGDKFDENVGVAKKAIDAFSKAVTDPATQKSVNKFKEMLTVTGLGNNPEMIRFLKAVGEAVSNDSIHVGQGGGARGPLPLEQRLYPTMHAQQAAE